MSTDLPGGWRTSPRLQSLIPKTHDWKTFASIPYAPRYAACICGGGVYDTQERRFLKPKIDKRNGRTRFRLVTHDPAGGKLGAGKMPYYSSVILELVEGPRRSRRMQAHHKNHDRAEDHWKNLGWATAKENCRMAEKHMSRKGFANPSAKLTPDELSEFIQDHDYEASRFGKVDLKPLALKYEITADQLRRIATGKSRAEEVTAIRLRFKQEQAAANEVARLEVRNRHYTTTVQDNPFLRN